MADVQEDRLSYKSISTSATEDATLAAIVRSVPDAVISKTVDGVVTSWNAAAEKLYGYRAQDMIGRGIEVTFPPESLDEERERHARVAAGEAESGFRCTRMHSDGHPVEVVMSMTPVYDVSGALMTIASISRPITNAERAQARYASLLEAAPDATVCVDGSGRITTANAQASNLFGYSREELLGAEVEMLLPEGVRQLHREHRDDFARQPQLRSMGQGLSLEARRRDGSVFPVEVSLAPDVSSGELTVIAAVRDVTSQREIEAVALENEFRLRQVTESVDIVFALLELNPFRYLYISSGIKALLGRDAAELLSNERMLADFVHPDDRKELDSTREAVASGRPVQGEYRMIPPDGIERWVRMTVTPVESDGHARRAVVTIEDISARIRASEALRVAEAAARTANEAKNQFLSRMSHELRTPLNAVLGFGLLLQRRLADTEYSDAIRHILKGGRHLLDLINDVLDIARIESGDMSLSTESVAVDEIVAETIELMHPLAEDAGVTLHTAAGDPGSHVVADRQRLRQILLNLLSNAIKYNHTGGSAWVGWSESEGHIAITVRDNGQGIAHEHLDRLFTPFDRLGAEASGVEGTGIGLALTRALSEMMGGNITVDSTPGAGSTFTLELLATTDALAPLAAALGEIGSEAPACPPETPQATLLYIEDNAPNVRVVEELLKLRPEWKLVHAATGSLGIELAVSQRPDLILLDLHLPDLSGRDVLTELKRRRELTGVTVIILTADAHVGLSRQLIVAGAAGYLTKPFDIDDVLHHLDVAFEAKGSRE